jgi:anhydro-N-acetylmuramic acid kinase
MNTQLYMGLNSGTSADSIDAALVDFATTPPTLLATARHPMPSAERQLILHAGAGGELTLSQVAWLDARLGEHLAAAALATTQQLDLAPGAILAIGSHGQTIRHRPLDDPAHTVQLGDAHIIAARTALTTIADFRRMDVALGGQGAPLTPIFHSAFLASPDHASVVVNIGGIANLTMLAPGGSVLGGFDTGPGNCLMDEAARLHLRAPCDQQGRCAGSGRLSRGVLQRWLQHPYFQAGLPKTAGPETFAWSWLMAQGGSALSGPDLLATLTALTATTIAAAIANHAPDTRSVLVCGGGIHNDHLMRTLELALQDHGLPLVPASTAQRGLDPDWIEPATFAYLAKLHMEGTPGNVPLVTGARRQAILGARFQGGQPCAAASPAA